MAQVGRTHNIAVTFAFVVAFFDTITLIAGRSVAFDYISEANKDLKFASDGSQLFLVDIKVPKSKASGTSSELSASIRFKDRLWPGGVVPYKLARPLERNVEAKRVIKSAMVEWETKTCIRFVERTTQRDYVEFVPRSGCNSDVGRHGGRQSTSLGDGCLHKSVVVHEIGHIIGFWHEQNRPDRDNFVDIVTDNILDGYKEAFAVFSRYRIDSLNVDYDYYSIMHYSEKAFSKNGRRTIVPKRSGVYRLGNNELSALDIKQANLLYKCDRIDRNWTSWSEWTTCDKSCGGGEQERTRVCTNLVDGKPRCTGSSLVKRVCNQQACPEWPKFPPDFSFVNYGNLNNAKCVLIYERADYQEWNHYFFCSRGERDIQMRWSDEGPIRGMKCTKIYEPNEPSNHKWFDNHLCLPHYAPYNFTWSHSGPLQGMQCLKWYAKNGRDGWDNNYLCTDSNGDQAEYTVAVVNGNWGSWTEWSVCTKRCGGGKRRRIRMCDNPPPSFGGDYCAGPHQVDSDCNTSPCAMSDCGGLLVGSKGEFHSPNYPENYPNDANCTWIVKGPVGKKLVLYLKSFDFENIFFGHRACNFDYLLIRENGPKGKHLGTFCGQKLPQPIAASTNVLFLQMVTDAAETHAGFRATWEVLDNEPEDCGGELSGTGGKISSPNYPFNYPHEKTCIWHIKVSDGYNIGLKFEDFDVESNAICKYDYVEIRDGSERNAPQLGRYCGEDPLKGKLAGVLKTTGNHIRITFRSDRTTSKRGFSLVWKAAMMRAPPKPVGDGSKELCKPGWLKFEDTAEGLACYKVKDNYFNWHGARDDCLTNQADLLSITTNTEQNFVSHKLLAGNFMWLGLTDKDSEGRWAWSDNTTTSAFRNWDGGDPNDGGYLHNEDCALLKPDGKWNDYPCEDKFKYICKRKPLEPYNLGLANRVNGQ